MLARNLFAYCLKKSPVPVQLAGYDIEKPDLLHGFEKLKFTAVEIFAGFPRVDSNRCRYCGSCVKHCSCGALQLDRLRPAVTINPEKCEACGECTEACPSHGISSRERLTGYILHGRLNGHSILIGKGAPDHNYLLPLVNSLNECLNPAFLAICDLGPGNSSYVTTALKGSSLAIILLNPARGWKRNTRFLLDILKDHTIPFAIVINKYRKEEGFLREVTDFCRMESVPLLGIIPYSADLRGEKSCNFNDCNSEMETIFAAILEGAVGL